MYFLQSGNLEFIIYVGVLILILGGVFLTAPRSKFPTWMLWGLSIWGLMHVLGGAVHIGDHVLFAQRIFPLIDRGGEFYVLKYDQVVHGYLYGLVAIMSYHVIRAVAGVKRHDLLVFLMAVLISVGISGLNEIMEFLISLNMQNGVGGYDNTMLDLCFNFGGALIATTMYYYFYTVKDGPRIYLR